MLDLPLRGVRVADFTWHGAGPYTTKMLADHGAEVIRIESSRRLDTLRNMPPFRNGEKGINRSGYYADRNSNKNSIVLNLKHPAARQVALDIIARSDVVANNFTPGTMDDLGLGYEAARAVKPDIIYLSMSMHGDTGPDSRQVGYGLTVSALSGLHHLAGLPDRQPIGTNTNYPDHVSAPCHAAFSLLVALRHRRRTGQGQYIDLAQTETMVSLLGATILERTANGRDTTRQGNLDESAAPHGVYPCAGDDRWIAIAVRYDREWRALAEVLGTPGWLDDKRFATVLGRRQHRTELDACIAQRTAALEAGALMQRLQERRVPAGVVQSSADLVDRDPQLRARGHFACLDHPEMGPSVYNSPPFRLCRVETPTMRRPAPLLGQHTSEVLTSLLGMDEEQVQKLVAEEALV